MNEPERSNGLSLKERTVIVDPNHESLILSENTVKALLFEQCEFGMFTISCGRRFHITEFRMRHLRSPLDVLIVARVDVGVGFCKLFHIDWSMVLQSSV
jgi:hypothetical protein